MHIDKYKQPDGWFKDEDGIDYEDAVSLLGSRLGFCGCGCPEDALRFVGKVLRLIKNHGDEKDWSREAYQKMIGFAEDEGLRYFVWYALDSRELIEHGGSVPGWLTGKGLEMLEDIEELLPQEE